MSSELLCKNCKHSFVQLKDWWLSAPYRYSCRKAFTSAYTEHNPVMGEIKHPSKYDSCTTSRMSRYTKDIKEDHCGPEGKLWEPKNKKYLFLAIKHSQR